MYSFEDYKRFLEQAPQLREKILASADEAGLPLEDFMALVAMAYPEEG